MINRLKYKKFFVLCFAVSIIYIFFACIKSGYFIDEIYSYGLANSYYKTDISEYDIYDRITGGEVFYDYLTVNNGEKFNYSSVYSNQIRDVHPPLYYMLLHTVCSFTPGRLLKSNGILLNFIFMYICLFFLYKLCLKIFKKEEYCEYLSLAAAAVYAFSCFAVSTVIYIRMYMMLTMLTVIYAYCHVLLVDEKKYIRLFPFSGFILMLGFMTQYYFIIPAFFISLSYFIYILVKKKFKIAALYTVIMLAALMLSYAVFPYFVSQLRGDNNTYMQNLSSDLSRGILHRLLYNCISFISNINYGMFGNMKSAALAAYILISCFAFFEAKIYGSGGKTDKVKLKTSDLFISIAMAVTGLTCIILFAVIWVPASRYYYNIVPFISIIFTYAFYKYFTSISGIGKKKYFICSLVLYLFFSCAGYFISISGSFSTKSGFNTDLKTVYPVEYIYLQHRYVDKFFNDNPDTDCIFITDYKNAAVTQDIYELMQCTRIYICSEERIEEAVKMLSAEKDSIIIIDVGSGLWGSRYNDSEILGRLKDYGFKSRALLYEKELTKAYIVTESK